MNGLPYYKAYPRDFIEGTIGMPFELKCAYRVVLDLIYMQGGKLPDDARYISGLLGCSIRKWKALRSSLISADKIQVNGEFLSNYRADNELETLAKQQEKQAENARRPRKNKDLQKPRLSHTEPEPEPEPKKEDTSVSSKARVDSDDVSNAVETWAAICQPVGLPVPRKITKARRAAIAARLRDEKLAGWEAACRRVADSPFCRGENDRGWKADIDFLATESKFNAVMEGKYDQLGHTNRAGLQDPAIANANRRRNAWREAIAADGHIGGDGHSAGAIEGPDASRGIDRDCRGDGKGLVETGSAFGDRRAS